MSPRKHCGDDSEQDCAREPSARQSGKTEPDSQALMRMADVYGINPYRLKADPTSSPKTWQTQNG
jgi:hypothetical protein